MTHKNAILNRRSFITGVTALMGSALAISACDAAVDYNAGAREEILSTEQLQMVERVANIIIPDTDTPGAAKAGVHNYINHMVAKFMTDNERAAFIKGLSDFNAASSGFLSLSPESQVAAVSTVDDNMKKDKFYRTLKGLVVTGYYTSEIGATEELIYDPVPGQYREVPFSELGRAWAT